MPSNVISRLMAGRLWMKFIPLAIPYHSSPIPMSMQYICKILLKFVYSFLRYWPKMHFGHKSRVITLLFLNEISSPTYSPNEAPTEMTRRSQPEHIRTRQVAGTVGSKNQRLFKICVFIDLSNFWGGEIGLNYQYRAIILSGSNLNYGVSHL